MEVELFGYVLEVSVKRTSLFDNPPTLWPIRNQRDLAQHISEVIAAGGFVNPSGDWSGCGDHFIGRIKACRWLLREDGYDGGLKECKQFVERAFSNNGRGSEIVL
jgi:hypothetical protein